MKFKKIAGALLVALATFTLASCKDKTPEGPRVPKPTGLGHKDPKVYTYKDATVVSPSNWNELTYQDNNDTQIMNFLGSNFFSFDFLVDENGQILNGQYAVVYSAATKLEDVTKKYAGDPKYSVPAKAEKSFAYKITLRKDLKWDDGTEIKAEDFVYSMQQQLDPKFKNFRADSYYQGSVIIHNAKNYVYQGDTDWYGADTPYEHYSTDLDSKLIFSLSNAPQDKPKKVASVLGVFGFPATWPVQNIVNYLVNSAGLGETGVTVDQVLALEGKSLADIKADASLNATWEKVIGWWQTEEDEELDFFVTEYTWPEVSFDNVGIKVGDNPYEIVVILDSSLALFKEDGSLSYQAPYAFSSLPLVHKAKYEANKVKPIEGANGLWTSTYNSSVASTASWGPYKLTEFQAGKFYKLERNENWFGYGISQYDGQYQTDVIECETIKEYNTQLLMFKSGKLTGVGIDVSVAQDYKNSEQAIFTPDDFVSSVQLQSSKTSLVARQTSGVNKSILSYTEFRKALSLGIDRADYTTRCTTSSLPGFGLFNTMHYYDVENGGVYRDTDHAKKVLCETYAVDPSQFPSLDDAVDSITGYNLAEARKLVDQAYDAAVAAGDLKTTDKVVLTVGTSTINASVQRSFDWFKDSWTTLMEGTKLAGKFELELVDKGTPWANDFKAGGYDIILGAGWTGAAWNPGYFLAAYLDKQNMYSQAWDTENETMTFTMKGVGANGEDVTETMGLMSWYRCLNGDGNAKYNWAKGEIDEDVRCSLIAALEGQVLNHYYTVPVANAFSSSLLSYQVEYITRDYNTFMAYGGVRYMTYNYDDTAWAAYVQSQGGEIDYTK